MHLLRLLVVGAVALWLSACTTASPASRHGAEQPGSDATACETTFSAARCSNLADYAATQLDTSWDDIVSVEILPPPTPEVVDGVAVINMGGRTVDMLVTLRDESVHEVSLSCAGIGSLPCRDDPQLEARSPILGGYHDVPCEGEPPDGCATPVPAPDPDALAAAKGLRVHRLDIPIDHPGHFEVPVGEATLPNGILTDATFRFASPDWPTDFAIAEGTVRLEIRSLDEPDRLFWNIYDHGWYEGTERVEALLVFEVLYHDPDAVLSISDLVVR